MSLRPGCSWSATTSGTRDGSGVPSGADESVSNYDCRYNPSRLQPTARRMRPPCGDQTGAPPNSVLIGPQAASVVPCGPVHLVGYSMGNGAGNTR